MPQHCPICRQEYRDEAETCADCDGALRPGPVPAPDPGAPDPPDSEAFDAAVFVTNDVFEAELVQAGLGEAGIDALVTDRETVLMDWLLAGALGGVKVVVRESEAEAAVSWIQRRKAPPSDPSAQAHGMPHGAASPGSPAPAPDDRERPPAACPRCGSEDVMEKPKQRTVWALVALSILTGGVALIIAVLYWWLSKRLPPVLLCSTCGNVFVAGEDDAPAGA